MRFAWLVLLANAALLSNTPKIKTVGVIKAAIKAL
jgi:hypothetical protein